MIEPGAPAPDFTLPDQDGNDVIARGPARADDACSSSTRSTSARSAPTSSTSTRRCWPICEEAGAKLVGDLGRLGLLPQGVPGAPRHHDPAARRLPPEGRGRRGLRRLHRGVRAHPARARDDRPGPDGQVGPPGAHAARDPGREPDLRRARQCGLTPAGSARSARRRPADDDHVRGDGPLVIEYGDYECPYCAKTDLMLAALPVRRVFRHFPVVSKHPRSRGAGPGGRGRRAAGRVLGDARLAVRRPGPPRRPAPLGARARAGPRPRALRGRPALGAVAERVQRDFRSGMRAGVTTRRRCSWTARCTRRPSPSLAGCSGSTRRFAASGPEPLRRSERPHPRTVPRALQRRPAGARGRRSAAATLPGTLQTSQNDSCRQPEAAKKGTHD